MLCVNVSSPVPPYSHSSRLPANPKRAKPFRSPVQRGRGVPLRQRAAPNLTLCVHTCHVPPRVDEHAANSPQIDLIPPGLPAYASVSRVRRSAAPPAFASLPLVCVDRARSDPGPDTDTGCASRADPTCDSLCRGRKGQAEGANGSPTPQGGTDSGEPPICLVCATKPVTDLEVCLGQTEQRSRRTDPESARSARAETHPGRRPQQGLRRHELPPRIRRQARKV
jgi:hypothetical protein